MSAMSHISYVMSCQCQMNQMGYLMMMVGVPADKSWKPRYSSCVCLATLCALLFGLDHATESEEEEEDCVMSLVSQFPVMTRGLVGIGLVSDFVVE